ncbi:MAG: hypothetical protein HUJ68_10425 [Clostridia bacterium]|nr:hypothetical protein [Clostridia bacterium]
MTSYFCKASQKNNLTEIERCWLIYRWVTENISYDFKSLRDGTRDCTIEGTYSKGKSVCSGYAALYKHFIDNLNIENLKVAGYSKGFSYKFGKTITETETHEWNAVKIEGFWYFVESTWGSGYSPNGGGPDGEFVKCFNDYHFFTPPEEYIRGLEMKFFSTPHDLLKKTRKKHENTRKKHENTDANFLEQSFNTDIPEQGHEGR